MYKRQEQTDAENGNDVYLSIDRDLQVGVYSLIEQSLAGILVSRLNNDWSYEVKEGMDMSNVMIPIRDAYYQLINNNILSMSRFGPADASDLEKSIYARFSERKSAVIPELAAQLSAADAPAFEAVSYTHLAGVFRCQCPSLQDGTAVP